MCLFTGKQRPRRDLPHTQRHQASRSEREQDKHNPRNYADIRRHYKSSLDYSDAAQKNRHERIYYPHTYSDSHRHGNYYGRHKAYRRLQYKLPCGEAQSL